MAGLVLAAASAMAHDLYVGVIREEHVTPQEQVRAARIATVIVGAMAITIGIAAKGQNVAHLVALAFAVAASANFPCVLLTLYWRKCNTGGIVAGMVVGTLLAVGPGAGVAEHDLSEGGPRRGRESARRRRSEARQLPRPTLPPATPPRSPTRQKTIGALDRAATKAKADIERVKGENTSLVGLEAPLFDLRNPGLISIPLGFLAVILGSLLYRDKRADDMWEELYARQNTGILASKAAAH